MNFLVFINATHSYYEIFENLNYTPILTVFSRYYIWNTLVNYFQIFQILYYLSLSEEDLRIFAFTPKVSPLFSLVFDV